ncbi:MAG: DMT family transporter [Bernardetiaceae bacterium]
MKNFLTHAALGAVSLIYAATYNIVKFVTPDPIGPFALVVMRVVGAALLFSLFHAWFIREPIRDRKDFVRLGLCSFFGVILNQLCFIKGVSLTTPINASVIMILSPVMVLLASALLLKEPLTRLKLLGIALGAAGVFWIIGGGGVSFGRETAMGDLLILTNAASYGLYLVLVKPLLVKYHALTVIRWVFLLGIVGVVPVGGQSLAGLEISAVPAYAWQGAAFVVVATTFLAYLLNAWALRLVNPSVVGFYIYLQPILTTFIAIWLGTDTLTWSKIGAASLIFLGVYAVTRPTKKADLL